MDVLMSVAHAANFQEPLNMSVVDIGYDGSVRVFAAVTCQD